MVQKLRGLFKNFSLNLMKLPTTMSWQILYTLLTDKPVQLSLQLSLPEKHETSFSRFVGNVKFWLLNGGNFDVCIFGRQSCRRIRMKTSLCPSVCVFSTVGLEKVINTL